MSKVRITFLPSYVTMQNVYFVFKKLPTDTDCLTITLSLVGLCKVNLQLTNEKTIASY